LSEFFFSNDNTECAGQSKSALPERSDIDLFYDGKSIIDLNAEIPSRALSFGGRVAVEPHADFRSAGRGVLLLRGNIRSNANVLEALDATAKAVRVELQSSELREPREFERDFLASADQSIGGFVMTDHAQFISRAAN